MRRTCSSPDIVRDCPEKVLAFRAEWARSHGDEVRALTGAVGDASRWAAAPGNRNSLVTLLTHGLARREPLDDRAGPCQSGLHLRPRPGGRRATARRGCDHGRSAAGETVYSDALAEAAAAVYAPALGPPISRPAATQVAFDGPAFSSNDIASYLVALKAGRPR